MLSYLRDLSLRAKITVSFVLIVIGGTSISTFLGSKIITRAMLNEAVKQIRHGLETADRVYANRLDSIRLSIVGAARTERLAATLASGRQEEVQRVLASMREENGLQFLTFIDARDRSKWTESTNLEPIPLYIKEAFAGRIASGTELIRNNALAGENAALAVQARMRVQPEPASAGKRTAIDEGMVLIAAAPVNTGSGFQGVLYGGILLNRDTELASRINDFVFGSHEGADNPSGTVSIFMNDVRIATNVRNSSGQPEIGVRAPADIYKTVYSKGHSYYGRDYVAGNWHLTASKPIRNYRNRIVGILYVGIPENPFLDVRTSMMLTFLLVAGIGVVVVLGITYLITRSMIHPLEEIVKASNRIAAGDLDHSVSIASQDEFGILANSFNKMLASIKTMKIELEEWGRTLEEKVNKRTDELVAVQKQMAQSEKLASIGRLAAGVAHEINNPLGGILTFSMLALEDCDDDHPMKQSLEVIVKQTLRCRETVKGLLDFARQSSAAPSITEVNAVVDKTLLLLENQTIFQNIKTVRKFDPSLPRVLIDVGELQQVIVNIVLNAVDAMEENGTLTIETCKDPEKSGLLIRVSDTGKGIPENILPLIFEPFFTTKQVGKGTGLGLSIVHGIITRAGGKIEATSSPKGATFTIRLPIVQEEIKGDRTRPEDPDRGTGKSAERR